MDPGNVISKHPQYVYLLPFTIRKQLAAILDYDNAWELLAFVMPDIEIADVQACRNVVTFESPTETLLTIWGSKGNKIIQLYNCLGRAKLVFAMRSLRHLIDPCYHHWEHECLQHKDRSNEEKKDALTFSLVSSMKDKDSMRLNYGILPWKCADDKRWLEPEDGNLTKITYATLQNTLHIKYDDIVRITDGFSPMSILGSGGYGTVYKAIWEQTQVAVKRIQVTRRHETQNEQLLQGLQELRMLSKYRHDNILPLYAYSLDGPEPCLLYQYMANGSLFDCIFKKNTVILSWVQRSLVMVGCARGLHFLHSVAKDPIIHGDVKSANILLDKHFEPKLGDFGLCRDNLSKEDWKNRSFRIASHVRGTMAYLPEEFLTERIVSTKLDVYSYGVVLLEIATGMKSYVVDRNPQNIVEYVVGCKKQLESSKKVEDILADQMCSFTNDSDISLFNLLLQVGLDCVLRDHNERPTFQEVLDKFSTRKPELSFQSGT